MTVALCKECGRREKALPRQRCATCLLRHEPIGEQVAAAQLRLAMVPEALRLKRGKATAAAAPKGTAWCAACQSYRDDRDFGKGATTCRACASGKSHSAAIEKTYGITGDDYARLLELQGGKCAVCRARPKSKRLVVDHNHTTGAVRGLLCARCNHEALGSLHDSLAMVEAMWHYMNTPPAGGGWTPPETREPLSASVSLRYNPDDRAGVQAPIVGVRGDSVTIGGVPVELSGAESVPGKRGVWRIYVERDSAPPF